MILNLTSDYHGPDCTLGILEAAGRKWHTLEPPLEPSELVSRTCIPAGEYRVEPRETEARGKHWLLTNPMLGVFGVPQEVPPTLATSAKSLALIQVGNFISCIQEGLAIGKGRERFAGQWRLTRSRDAMNELKQLLSGKFEIVLVVNRQTAETAATSRQQTHVPLHDRQLR